MWLINEFITGRSSLQVAPWLNQGSVPRAGPTSLLAGAPPGVVVVAWWVAGTAWLEGNTGQVSPCCGQPCCRTDPPRHCPDRGHSLLPIPLPTGSWEHWSQSGGLGQTPLPSTHGGHSEQTGSAMVWAEMRIVEAPLCSVPRITAPARSPGSGIRALPLPGTHSWPGC